MGATEDFSGGAGSPQCRLKLVFNKEKKPAASPTPEVVPAQPVAAVGQDYKEFKSPPYANSFQATRISRTGRVIKAPTAFTPAPAAAGSGGKRRSGGRKTTSVNCAECGRGHSPSNNPIVFCDGCESAWHKHCHDPQIPEAAIVNLETEWKCGNCDPSQRRLAVKVKPFKTKPAKAKKPASKAVPAAVVAPKLEPELQPAASIEVAGDPFTDDEKRAWLSTLAHSTLVDMLVDISTKNPFVPIFPANMKELPASQFAVPPVQPSSAEFASPSKKRTHAEFAYADRSCGPDPPGPKRARTKSAPAAPVATLFTGKPSRHWSIDDPIDDGHFFATLSNGYVMRVPHTSLTPALSPDAPSPFETGPLTDSEGDDIPFDDHRVYPKPGNGFILPSNPMDLDILLEDPESKTFSHDLHSAVKAATKTVAGR